MVMSGPLVVPPMGPGRFGPRPWCPFYRQRVAAGLGSVDQPTNPFEALAWFGKKVGQAAKASSNSAVTTEQPKAPTPRPLRRFKAR